MSDYRRLKRLLARRPFLVADADGGVDLVDQATAFRLLTEAGPLPTQAVMNVGHSLESFARLPEVGKEDRTFKLSEIAAVAGLKYHLAYNYVQRGIFTPSAKPFGGSGKGKVEARFNWEDCFVAGVVGTLRRLGMGVDVLPKVGPLFTGKKQAAEQLATAGRP